MEVEVIPKEKALNVHKHHIEDPQDAEVDALKAKYAVVEKKHSTAMTTVVNPDDVHAMIKKYSENLRVDLYTIAKTFNFDLTTVGKLLNSETYKEEYEAAKRKRGEIFAQSGYEIALTPYEKLMAGEKIPPALVKAATLASNYSLHMARSFNSQFSPQKENDNDKAPTVIVNTGVQLNI